MLTLDARSTGTAPIKSQVALEIATGLFVVTTTADGGPGSLRQAILDSNATPGATNTIDFDIPGDGVQTIGAASTLPAISNPVVIDGTSQPGYAGTPLIAVVGVESEGADPLAIGSDVTIRGLSIQGVSSPNGTSSTTLTLDSIPLPTSDVMSYQLDVSEGEDLVVTVQAMGTTASLALLDAEGQVVVRSDGESAALPVAAVDTYVSAGAYALQVQGGGGGGTFTLMVTLTPSTPPLQPIPVGDEPVAMVEGDFGGDGNIDLAVVNRSDNDVAILMGNGDGTFQTPVNYPVGSSPDAIVAGDFSDNGILDLAVANYADNDVSILMGNGDGMFRPVGDYPVGNGPDAIVAGAFGGDGILDLAVGGAEDQDVSILMGNGDGTFRAGGTIPTGGSPAAIVAGDFNGDGRLDLAVLDLGIATLFPLANQLGVDVLLGNGDGTFEPPEDYLIGYELLSIGNSDFGMVAGDFGGDGILDLAVADNGNNDVSVLAGNGDGTFQPPIDYTVGNGPGAIATGDFGGPGIVNLAVGYPGSGSFSILMGNGDGTFQAAEDYSLGYNLDAIVAGQFDDDGVIDLAVASGGSNTVSIIPGRGDGTFPNGSLFTIAAGGNSVTPNGPFISPFTTSAMATGDFNGDGRLDLAIADGLTGSISILLGNGDGTFRLGETIPLGVDGSDIAAIVAGDFNGDGRLDLALLDEGNDALLGSDPGGVYLLLGNGDGTFQPAVKYAAGDEPDAMVAGEFGGDGILNLAAVDAGDGDVSILMGNGDGTFRAAVDYPVGGLPLAIVAGDFSDDGVLNLAVADIDFVNANGAPTDNIGFEGVSILMGNGDGTFRPAVNYPVGGLPLAIVVGDFGGDGILDLAVNNGGGVSILLGNGDGTFRAGQTIPVPAAAMVIGDFNGDGQLDLGLVGASDESFGASDPSGFYLLQGSGDGTFQAGENVDIGTDAVDVAAGDFTGNGRSDLALLDQSSDGSQSLAILLSSGDGTFSPQGQSDNTPKGNPLVADVNGDGTDDVFVVDGSGDILYRQGIPGQPGSFQPPVIVNPGHPSRDVAWVPDTADGPLLASVDAEDDAISLYAYRDGTFDLVGDLPTGREPAQIIAADLDGDGLDDLVVRNAGEDTLLVFHNLGAGPDSQASSDGPSDPVYDLFEPLAAIPVPPGISDVLAADTTGDGLLDLVITNDLTGQVSVVRNEGDGHFALPVPYRAGTSLLSVNPDSTPEVSSQDATAGVAAGSLIPAPPPAW